VGTVVLIVYPVKSDSCLAIASPLASNSCVVADGANAMMIGLSGVPSAAGAAVGASVGASVATSVGVAAGPQAESAIEKTTIRDNRKNVRRLFMSFSSL